MAEETAVLAASTVLAKFTLKGDAAEFESVFADQAGYMRLQNGFIRTVLLRSVRQQDSYLSVGTWADERSYLSVVRTAQFANYVFGPFKRLVDGDSDKTTSVAGYSLDQVDAALATGTAVLAVTTFMLHDGVDATAFERGFLEHAGFVREQDGFVAHEFLRLTKRPGGYVNLGWWRDQAAYLAVLRSQTMRQDAKQMAGLVDASGDLYRTVATFVPPS